MAIYIESLPSDFYSTGERIPSTAQKELRYYQCDNIAGDNPTLIDVEYVPGLGPVKKQMSFQPDTPSYIAVSQATFDGVDFIESALSAPIEVIDYSEGEYQEGVASAVPGNISVVPY